MRGRRISALCSFVMSFACVTTASAQGTSLDQAKSIYATVDATGGSDRASLEMARARDDELVGGAGAVLAFDQAHGSSQPAQATAATTAAPSAAPTQQVGPAGARRHQRSVVRWAPCPAGSTLTDGVCVTDVVRTVVVPGSSTPVSTQHTGSTGGTSAAASHHDDDGERGEHGGGDDDRGDD